MRCFLAINGDLPEDFEPCDSISQAKRRFLHIAQEFEQFGQGPATGAVYLAKSRDEVGDYPHVTLDLGPRGGVVASNC